MKRQFEPFWWTWFSAGGTISAFILPALAAIFGIVIPLGWVEAPSHEHLHALMDPVISRAILFLILSLSFLHWAHRFRFTLYDGLQLQHMGKVLSVLCYGSAIALILFAGFILWRF